MNIRIIPRLDIKGSNLVKGIHLEGLRVLGKPEDFARHYYTSGADELLYIDIVASLYERNSLLPIVERTAREIFIPLTVGGGLRTLLDMKQVLRAGADKVACNTAFVRTPELIAQAAAEFGSSTVVLSIEAKKRPDGHYECYTDNGRVPTGRDAVEWARYAADHGAGEILVTSIDREGTGKGYDTDLIRLIARTLPIPVIACGGAGTSEHVLEAIRQGCADAVSAASLFHYEHLPRLQYGEHSFEEGNVNFLMSGQGFSRITPCAIDTLKTYLAEKGIPCRTLEKETDHAVRCHR